MPTLQNMPTVAMCEACSGLFTALDKASGKSIREQIRQTGGYRYHRTRRELERGAKLGCPFCSTIASHDDKRPHWYPPEDAEVVVEASFDIDRGVLAFCGRNGLELATEQFIRTSSVHWKLYAPAGDPVSAIIPQTAVLTNFASPQSFIPFCQYLHECLASHQECLGVTPVELPTRLIELSLLGEPETALLQQTQGVTGVYCALSYCWGGPQPFATTIARNMGIRYIWVDSFCIIQDSQDDVRSEMTKMLDMYTRAQFTVSAASASSCNQGFLGRFPDAATDLFKLPVHVGKDIMGSALISKTCWPTVGGRLQPINKRAWTFQESLLAQRLLIFTEMNMLLKCNRGFHSDPAIDIN
ncbi:heterokaryon incompatibility protein [Hirsutella rhossiliensis]|uniref:Heterokaryon incompatibility protein (HET) domain-containing protein n=1 Tax=Hirsutella rhossiliensis TaxID=111463 RepID=A0A9P8N446_9HYPO|nr:heterokaryon incompatibility protein (HET) domain-containing protein [Hirsutella rhossiliensis]KAH0968033.1 heterokaryon incompatibility protein (HET) domain-containing protein [Hirsutella rhossiliensis]